jgi:hypothetical protein
MKWIAIALWTFACGGQPPAASANEDELTISRAEDEVALRLEDEGIEDADTLISDALSLHGLSAPDIDQVRGTALRAQLRRVARATPRAEVNALFAATMKAWEEIAALSPANRVLAVADLAGFDPAAPPVAISAEAARAAAGHPEAGLDAHSRALLQEARAAVIAAIGQHLDLAPAEAAARAQPIDLAAHTLARQAALAFAGLPAASAHDPALAASRALRFTWQRYQDHGVVDEAWPQVAFALGLEVPPPSRGARPEVQIDGSACAANISGLECTTGGSATVRLDGTAFSASGASAGALASALLDALPAGFVGCILDAGLLRIDRRGGAFDVAVESGALTIRGSFPAEGSRPQILLGFAGNELRVLVRPVADASAPASFTETIPLPRRLPRRLYEIEVEDAEGNLLAAAALDAR